MKEFTSTRAKNIFLFSRQQWGKQKSVIKLKIYFEDYKHCFATTRIDNKINHIEKIKLM